METFLVKHSCLLWIALLLPRLRNNKFLYSSWGQYPDVMQVLLYSVWLDIFCQSRKWFELFALSQDKSAFVKWLPWLLCNVLSDWIQGDQSQVVYLFINALLFHFTVLNRKLYEWIYGLDFWKIWSEGRVTILVQIYDLSYIHLHSSPCTGMLQARNVTIYQMAW